MKHKIGYHTNSIYIKNSYYMREILNYIKITDNSQYIYQNVSL